MRDPLKALVERWEKEANALERMGHEGHAHDVRRRIEELKAADREYFDQELTISEAAEEQGYSQKHLRELCRKGRLRHRKRDGSYLIRRGDLPRKSAPPEGRDLGAAERLARRASS